MPSDPAPIVVRSARSPRSFLDLQRRFYRGDPCYVPPLTAFDAWQVDVRRNPFFAHAEGAFFVAERNGAPVARASAVRDELHDRFHGDRVGFFGHFEAADRAAAHAILAHAEGWLRARGATVLRGPVDLSTNYRCGLLIEGEPGPPVVMMPYNPPAYHEWLESYGLAKAKDLLALMLEERLATPERFDRLAERIRARTRAQIRPFDMRRFRSELEIVWALYNKAWERNWGFVPMTEAEFMRSAKELKPIAKRELLSIVEIDGQPVAFALNIPDVNVAVRACGGRLLPFGWWKFLRALRRTTRTRVLTLGVHQGHRKNGLDALLLHYYRHKNPELGYPQCEASWILEDNHEMLRVLRSLGARDYRRYRIFEKRL
jgi:GNAT superfamily N-acetyltransferase